MESPVYEKVMQGDHAAIMHQGKAMSLDEIVVELNILFEISCVSDDAPILNMNNYDESQVVEINEAISKINALAFARRE